MAGFRLFKRSSSDPESETETRHEHRGFRERVIPRSVLGLTAMILSFSVGASLSGVAFYAYYQYQQTQTVKKIDGYISGFDDRFRTASDTIENEKQNAQATIQEELSPLVQSASEGRTLGTLSEQVKGSVWFVSTQDDAGNPSVGTAFVVQSNENSSLLVTSYKAVEASAAAPAPAITLAKGDDQIGASLVNWVENQDLAVLRVDRGNMPALEFVPESGEPRVGDKTFVAGGLGAAGASVTQGFVNDVSDNAIQQDAPVGNAYQGGPLLNADGQVMGVASLNFAPFGFPSTAGVTFAVPIRDTCGQLLTCPDDLNSVSGANSR